MVLVRLLYEKGDTAVLARDDTDSLFQQLLICISFVVAVIEWLRSWVAVSYLVGDLALILYAISQLFSDFV